jgi:hypothetical protein
MLVERRVALFVVRVKRRRRPTNVFSWQSREGRMVNVHMIVGTLVLIAYVALAITNGMQLSGARTFSWSRQLSMAAAGLLLLQYVLGFGLLGSHSITATHYLVALAAIIPVGYEHMVANTQDVPSTRARLGMLAASATALLVLIAYAIAESR